MNWQPIETYDELKEKPKFAVFYVKPKPSEDKQVRHVCPPQMQLIEEL